MVGGKILKFGRRLRGMTQTEVAEFYGVSLRTYRRWEDGSSLVPTDDLCAICTHVFKLQPPCVTWMPENA